MPQLAYTPPDAAVLLTPAAAKLELVRALVIDSPVMFGEAGDEIMAIAKRLKELETQRDGIVRPLNTAVKAINDLFRPATESLESAKKIIGGKMDAYTQDQKRIADDARKKADADAIRERDQLNAQSAATLAKANQKAEDLRQQAVEATEKGDVARAASLESKATSTLNNGEQRAMNLQVEAASVTAMPMPIESSAGYSGFSGRGTWKAKVTDKAKLVAFIAANPQYLNLIEIPDKGINALAKALKQHWNLPGSQAYEDRGFAVRTA